MAIYLGNQTISDLERRTGYVFSDEDRKWLESHRQDKADVEYNSDKFHIFERFLMPTAKMPLQKVCSVAAFEWENTDGYVP